MTKKLSKSLGCGPITNDQYNIRFQVDGKKRAAEARVLRSYDILYIAIPACLDDIDGGGEV